MARTDELISVFVDTVDKIESGEYPKELEFNLLGLIDVNGEDYTPYKRNNCVIRVDNRDCIEVANELSKLGQTCMLNMASPKTPGGGVRRGSMAQEEELARRSNLIYGLPEECYPLDVTEFLYTKDVTFFKDKYYQLIPDFKCDVITMAAFNLNNTVLPKEYQSITELKIRNMLWIPSEMGCENLVLSAFGCGVFKNDPYYISELFKKYLDSGFASLYKSITFAIINDRNSVGSNFEIFKSQIQP
jgi:uncharacterized protein (TIGR02452 family)